MSAGGLAATEVLCRAYDLRNRLYDRRQRLSLACYDSHQLGTSLSTVIDAVKTIQALALSGTLDRVEAPSAKA